MLGNPLLELSEKPPNIRKSLDKICCCKWHSRKDDYVGLVEW